MSIVRRMSVVVIALVATACPSPPSGPTPVQIDAGQWWTCATMTDNSVRCWGHNSFNTIAGPPDESWAEYYVAPKRREGVVDAASVSLGDYQGPGCVVHNDAAVSCWGRFFGAPEAIVGLSGVEEIASGSNHACALLDDATVKCFGVNSDGVLGNGTFEASEVPPTSVPDSVVGLSGVEQVAAGERVSCAALTDGSVKCWGRQYGVGATDDSNVPVAVPGLTNVTDIDVAEGTYVNGGAGPLACAVDAGSVKCWSGLNVEVLPGGAALPDTTVLPGGESLTGVTEVAAGRNHACALEADATVSCWGIGVVGQLGNGQWVDSATPVKVSGLTDVVTIAAGTGQTCALTAQASMWCWGYGANGELGTGSTANSAIPRRVTL